MGKIYTPKELLGVLIGFDTTSFRSNRDMIDFIVDYLSSHGISSSLGFNEEETKRLIQQNEEETNHLVQQNRIFRHWFTTLLTTVRNYDYQSEIYLRFIYD